MLVTVTSKRLASPFSACNKEKRDTGNLARVSFEAGCVSEVECEVEVREVDRRLMLGMKISF